MQIIKFPDYIWSKQVTCSRETCKAVIEININDVQYKIFSYYNSDGDQISNPRWYVVCPICGKFMYLKEEDLPK